MVPSDTASPWLDGDELVASLGVLSESIECEWFETPGDSNLLPPPVFFVFFCFRSRGHVSLFSLGTGKGFPLGIIFI